MGVDYKASLVVGVLLNKTQVMLIKDDDRFQQMIDYEVYQCGDLVCGDAEYVVGVQVKRSPVDSVGYMEAGSINDFSEYAMDAENSIYEFNDIFGYVVKLDPSHIKVYLGLEVG